MGHFTPLAEIEKALHRAVAKYNPYWANEPRDWHGRWTSGGGTSKPLRPPDNLVVQAPDRIEGQEPPPLPTDSDLEKAREVLRQYFKQHLWGPYSEAWKWITVFKTNQNKRFLEYARWMIKIAQWRTAIKKDPNTPVPTRPRVSGRLLPLPSNDLSRSLFEHDLGVLGRYFGGSFEHPEGIDLEQLIADVYKELGQARP